MTDFEPSAATSSLPMDIALSGRSSPFTSPSPNWPYTPSYVGSFDGATGPPSDFGGSWLDDDDGALSEYEPSAFNSPFLQDNLQLDSSNMPGLEDMRLHDVDGGDFNLSIIGPGGDPQLFNASDVRESYSNHGSPGSSNGGQGTRSRASSVSSNYRSVSPNHIDLAFEGMTFNHTSPGDTSSTAFPTVTAPSPPSDYPSPPGGRLRQSPPLLRIPDGNPGGLSVPTVSMNGMTGLTPTASNPNGLMPDGPGINITPATPISGGAGVTSVAPFNSQHRAQTQASPSWDSHQTDMNEPSTARAQPPLAQSFNNSFGGNTASTFASSPFLVPQPHPPPRIRSRSDPQPPAFINRDLYIQQHQQINNTVRMNDVLPDHQSQPTLGVAPFGASPFVPQQPMHPSLQYAHPGQPSNQQQMLLTPDYGDAARRMVHRRAVRSEDFSQQLINGTLQVPGMSPPMPPGSPGLHRRTSSGSHSHSRERTGYASSLSSARNSPYPSPHPSPMSRASPLPPADVHIAHAVSSPANAAAALPSITPQDVARQNVTTHATADASLRRRKTPAQFQCPVPGCGSTFTRMFNLRGHMRSHNEERPFKCKWPGCEKGFARQHDCKRHEQLHLNIRPFSCEGCGKQFARMDALNRHLRSDNGTECAARQMQHNNNADGGGQNGVTLQAEHEEEKPGRSLRM